VGTWTFTSITITDAADQEAELESADSVLNRPLPMTMDIGLDDNGYYEVDCAVVFPEDEVDFDDLSVWFQYSDGRLEDLEGVADYVPGQPVAAKVTLRDGPLVWDATIDFTDTGYWEYAAVWTATKQ
jgi:hypothetical protein